MDQIGEAVEPTGTGIKHIGTYGKSFDADEPEAGEKPAQAEPAVKRGRGRPRKDSGEPRWDTETLAKWIIGNRPAKLPGKPGVKHRLKEWMEEVQDFQLAESAIEEGRMSDVHIVISDIASGEESLDRILNKPTTPEEKMASSILRMMMKEAGGKKELMDRIKADFGGDLNEVALDQSQVAVPQIKAPGAAPQPTAATGAAQPAQIGAAVIDFKDPKDPLKAAIAQAAKNKEVTVLATESAGGNETEAEKLKKILANYPMEQRMALEGWGMHEALYQALCDHYWNCGRIPKEKMRMGGQELMDWVEECWAQDTLGREQIDEVIPAVVGSMAGRALAGAAGMTSGAAQAGMGALGSMAASSIADKMQQAFEASDEIKEEEKWIKGAIKKPGAFTAKAKSHGMTTKQFIRHVLANKDDFPAETERQANLAKTLAKLDEGNVSEVITKKTKIDKIISDFVHSKDKRFHGKSKKERIEMAKGAYYGMHPELKRGEDKPDAQMEAWSKQLNTLINEGITFSTSTGSGTGGDSVTISATDSDASDLMKLIQNSGLIKTQADALSKTSEPADAVVVEPVSHDEVMDTLEPEDDGASTFDFIKRMVAARNDQDMDSSSGSDYESEDHTEVCADCGHVECECPDHGNVSEADNYEQTQHSNSDHSMSPVPEAELVGGQKKLDVAPPHGKLTAADFEELRKKKVKESVEDDYPLDPQDYADPDDLDEEALDQPATMEGEGTEHSHDHGEKLDEWANTVGGSSKDESFIADMEFITKSISGGLNNIKQDQTVVPSARVKTDAERFDDKTSIGELLRKLQGIN